VLFLCDGSGSLLGTPIDFLKKELEKQIDDLVVVQAFSVAFFQADSFVASSPRLVMASPRNREIAKQFVGGIDVKANSDPIPALNWSFSIDPEVIYLATDGSFDNAAEILAELRRLNRKHRVHVHTIGLFTKDALESERKQAEELLTEIAAENGGKFKAVEVPSAPPP